MRPRLMNNVPHDRSVPAYVSRATLAAQLDVAESTIDQMVTRGILPRPLHLSSGCVRWRWADVENALLSLGERTTDLKSDPDPYLAGVTNVTTKSPPARRG
jgi:predicted DNA-binding transcriptional regulator AlpA